MTLKWRDAGSYTRYIRLILGELPLVLWHGFFPIVAAGLTLALFGLSDQGRELLVALETSGMKGSYEQGLTQLVLAGFAGSFLVGSIMSSSFLAMHSIRRLQPDNLNWERLVVLRYVPAWLGAFTFAVLIESAFSAFEVAAPSSFIDWTAFLLAFLVGRALRASFDVGSHSPKTTLVLAGLVFLVCWEPVSLGGRKHFISLPIVGFVASILIAGIVAISLHSSRRWTSSVGRWGRRLLLLAPLVVVAILADRGAPLSHGAAAYFAWLLLSKSAKELSRVYTDDYLAETASSTAKAATLVGFVLLVCFNFAPDRIGRLCGAPALVALALAAWSVTGTLLFVWVPCRSGYPAMTVLALILPLLLSPVNDNHAVRLLAPTSPLKRAKASSDFLEWYDRSSEGDLEFPVFLVAAAGGGLRAAYWTADVLAELDDATCGEFGRHIYAISGVSGGSLGGAAYIGAIRSRRSDNDIQKCRRASWMDRPPLVRERVRTFLSNDFLSPVVGSLLFSDVVQKYLPLPILRDRAFALESSWEARWKAAVGNDIFASSLADFYEVSRRNALPALILNATRVEDGKRAVFSPVQFTITDGHDLLEQLPEYTNAPLSAAVHTSARFTFVSPAGVVRTSSGTTWGRLVDGGYFENSGAASLSDLSREMYDGWQNSKRAGRPRVVALIIGNDPTADRNVCDSAGQPVPKEAIGPVGGNSRTWLPELLSPVDTLLNARESRAPFHEVELAERISTYFERPACSSVLELRLGVLGGRTNHTVFAEPGPLAEWRPPLGWFLHERSAVVMNQAAHRALATTPLRYAPDCVHARPGPQIIQWEFDECSGRETLGGGTSRAERWLHPLGRLGVRSSTELLQDLRKGGHVLLTVTAGSEASGTDSIATTGAALGSALSAASVSCASTAVSAPDSKDLAIGAGFAAITVADELGSPSFFSTETPEAHARRFLDRIQASFSPDTNTLLVADQLNAERCLGALQRLAPGEVAVFEDSNDRPEMVGRITLSQWDTLIRLSNRASMERNDTAQQP